MIIKWIKAEKTVTEEGTTIVYAYGDTGYTVESRKRHIPHSNGRPGTWDHTSFFVLRNGKELFERSSLQYAQIDVEKIYKSSKEEHK